MTADRRLSTSSKDPDLTSSDDRDSGFDEESIRATTASLTSSILEYRTLHGRTYQASQTTEYWAPNDHQHVDAFDIAHQWLTMLLDDKLYTAPIGDSPQRILDVGTGNGVWAIDIADEFPSAEVIGTDISPTQPSWIPPNLTFRICDAQLEWDFEPDSFDFIHVRYMHGAIADWPAFYDEMFRCLKPGGWFQHLEPNIEIRCTNPAVPFGENHVFRQWAQLFYDAGERISSTFRFDKDIMLDLASGAGFTDLTHKKYKLPHGRWPRDKKLKQLGMFTELYMDMSMDGFVLYPIGQILGWSFEEVQALARRMRSALHSTKNRPTSDVHVVYGRKPTQ